LKRNNLYIISIILLSSCGDGGSAKTDEPTPDTAIGLTLSKKTATTSSSGEADTFTVKLKTKESVSVSLSSSNTDAGSISHSTLTFSESNWNVVQTVTVTGLCDKVHTTGTSKETYNVILTPSSANYTDSQAQTVVVTDTDKAAFEISLISGNVYEKGDNATFNMRLCSQPSSNVSIGVSSGDTTEGTVGTSNLIFSTDNWTTSQTVSVYSVDDNLSDDDETFSIVLAAASSSDSNYNSLDPSDVTVINKDNDTADITVSETTLTTTEAGGTDNFTVELDTGPESDVIVIPTSSNTSRATISPLSATFTSSNWGTAQAFTVTGVDDNVDNVGDNETYNITFSITSSVIAYSSLSLDNKSITGTNTDNDTAAILIDTSSLQTVSEFLNSSFITVTLATIPTANVILPVSSGNTTEGTVSPSALVITPANWNTPTTVTVTGVDDSDNITQESFNIIFDNATSSDANYNNLAPNKTSVPATNIDDFRDG